MGGGSGKGEGGKAEIPVYSMSMHLGICATGEGLTLRAIRIGGKVAWIGRQMLEGPLRIKRPNLFGGLKKEGGVRGIAYWLPGGRDQVLPDAVAERYGRAADNCPGYRGLASLFFMGEKQSGVDGPVIYGVYDADQRKFVPIVGAQVPDYVFIPSNQKWYRVNSYNRKAYYDPESEKWETISDSEEKGEDKTRGFIWGANNPYLRPVEVVVERISQGLTPRFASIPVDPEKPNGPQSCNPAHMIYEAWHNRQWGVGARPGTSGRASFEIAARTLYEERFGLAGWWMRQSSIEDFINEILDHINATFFINPRTGQFDLKLLRYDYDLDDLRVITPSDAKIVSMERKTWGETANEIVVTYREPEGEEDASVTAHDLAAIASQGEIVSSSRDFHLIRSRAIAAMVANREVAQSVRPLAAIELEMPRTGWDITSGEVVILRGWVEQIYAETLVCRVAKVSKPDPRSNVVRVSLYEDIFAEALNSYVEPEKTEHQPTAVEPAPLMKTILMTAPATLMASVLKENDPADLVPPEALVMLLAKRNSADDQFFDLMGQVTLPNGQVVTESLGLRQYFGTSILPEGGLAPEASSVVALQRIDGGEPMRGQFLLIGEPSDEHEIVNVVEVNDDKWTLLRGLLDTTPKRWPGGTTVWRIPRGGAVPDVTIRAAGETVTYTLLPTTSLDTLEIENATPLTTVVTRRPHLPLRPANVRIDGNRYEDVNATGKTSVAIQWSNRNRSVESPQVLRWEEGNVTPEVGQVTIIRLLDDQQNYITEIEATGTLHTLNLTAFQGRSQGYIRVMSKRGADYSLQGMTYRVTNIGA